jgi:hypothetical protein
MEKKLSTGPYARVEQQQQQSRGGRRIGSRMS